MFELDAKRGREEEGGGVNGPMSGQLDKERLVVLAAGIMRRLPVSMAYS